MAQYKHAIVTFLDLLGFASAVDGGKPVGEILRMLKAVNDAAHEDADTKKIVRIEYMCVSDCMIRSAQLDGLTKVTAPELQAELLRIVHMQCELILQGFPIRGAISHGNIYFEGRTLFGPAYQRAYLLERDTAKSPRVIVDPMVIDDYVGYPEADGDLSHGGAWDELTGQIRKDTDGIWFVDCLRSYRTELDDEDDYPKFLLAHRKLVLERLSAFAGSSVHAKYVWMKCYHNLTVSELANAFFAHYGVKRDEFMVT